jgi:hypothetical protein
MRFARAYPPARQPGLVRQEGRLLRRERHAPAARRREGPNGSRVRPGKNIKDLDFTHVIFTGGAQPLKYDSWARDDNHSASGLVNRIDITVPDDRRYSLREMWDNPSEAKAGAAEEKNVMYRLMARENHPRCRNPSQSPSFPPSSRGCRSPRPT